MLGCALLFQDSRLDIMLTKSSARWNLMERKFLGIKSWRWFSCCCLITAKDPGGSTWMGLGDFAKRSLGANQVPRANRYHGSLACKYSQNVNSRSISSEVLKESKTRKAGVELWEETHFKRSSDSQLVESFASRWVVHHKIVAHLCIRCPVKAPMCAEGFLVHLLPEQDGGNQRQSGPLLGNEAWRHNDTMVWKVTILTTLPNTDLWL